MMRWAPLENHLYAWQYIKMGFVYALREREFIRLDEPVIKIGRTRKWEIRRGQYPKGSQLLALIPVSNAVTTENLLIETFKTQFIQRSEDIGIEYFEGDMDRMLRLFISIASRSPPRLSKTKVKTKTTLSYVIETYGKIEDSELSKEQDSNNIPTVKVSDSYDNITDAILHFVYSLYD